MGRNGIVAETPERYCSNCGQELRPQDQFCSNCGQPVHQTARVPTPEADIPVPLPLQAGSTPTPPPQGEVPPRRSTANKLLVAGCVGVGLIAVLVVLVVVVPLARPLLGFTCDAKEKAALAEFPQYGGRVIGKDIKGPLGGERLNFPPLQEPPPGCQLGFTDRQATSKQVAAYYEKQLTKHGWKVKQHPVSPDPQSDEPGDFIYPHVDGARNYLRYEVHYWPTSLGGSSKMSDFTEEALNRDGTGVQVLVYRR